MCGMISQQRSDSSDLPFPSGKAKDAPFEHTTLLVVAPQNILAEMLLSDDSHRHPEVAYTV